jgi:hypothetical protein
MGSSASASQTFPVVEKNNATGAVPVGTCAMCGIVQTRKGRGGLWIMRRGFVDWHCHSCRRVHKLRSYPVCCEWCRYNDVAWHQGHTYKCPRCANEGIDHKIHPA